MFAIATSLIVFPITAVKAFEYSALDYLLKPIDKKDIERVLNKLKTKQTLLNSAQKVKHCSITLTKKIPIK